jgi:hypothetical protein
MNEDKLYLSNSMMRDIIYEELIKSPKTSIPNDVQTNMFCDQKKGINGPAYASHIKNYRVLSKTIDNVTIMVSYWYYVTPLTLNILYQAVRGPIVWCTPGYEQDRRIWPHFVMNAKNAATSNQLTTKYS